MITSRGCPYDCNFCSTHPTAGYKWRPRSPKNVLEELMLLNTKFEVNHIEIEDDNFSLNKTRTKKILENIITYNMKTDIPLKFSTPSN